MNKILFYKQLFIFAFLSLCLGNLGVSARTGGNFLQEIKSLKLPGVTITAVEDVPSENFTPPGGKRLTNLPAFIRIAFTSKPTPESNIQCEIWMPKNNWNGRFGI